MHLAVRCTSLLGTHLLPIEHKHFTTYEYGTLMSYGKWKHDKFTRKSTTFHHKQQKLWWRPGYEATQTVFAFRISSRF